MLTLVIDVHPLIEFAFVRDIVELAALDGSEAGLAMSAWLIVTDLVSAALTEAVSSTILRAEGHRRKEITLYCDCFCTCNERCDIPAESAAENRSCFQRLPKINNNNLNAL